MADTNTHRKSFLQALAAIAAGVLLLPRKSGAAPARELASAESERANFPVEVRKAPRAIERVSR
ncbi:hypothetical protein [Cerasicoccus arenae]|uniref:hypothetical protein n=1 Tax=Cerasicoccus arenae TaxID=424488 RepID=UPI0016758346|nr:hypothetical protein [Cerasicoccus arenae]MBK1858535.1 hypothetical protein [Cerasicoccus arenae]